jgi:hypothetical protein
LNRAPSSLTPFGHVMGPRSFGAVVPVRKLQCELSLHAVASSSRRGTKWYPVVLKSKKTALSQ